jgi:hypothetical protein
MKTLGFGQRTGQIVQMAYVLLDSFGGAGHTFRGGPSKADVAIAMAFAGHMQIELIQPKDDHPSVYKEIADRRGYGFHHFGIAVEDTEAERAVYEQRGYEVAYHAPVPSGGAVYYMDDGKNEPGFVELIPATPGMDDMFTRYWRASVEWKGEDPIRPFG